MIKQGKTEEAKEAIPLEQLILCPKTLLVE
jgi:hypothetical protein